MYLSVVKKTEKMDPLGNNLVNQYIAYDKNQVGLVEYINVKLIEKALDDDSSSESADLRQTLLNIINL